jgi:hypothetical protein
LLGAAYGRAYRLMRSIRETAGRCEADDALILTRALLSVVGRSLYIVQPDDEAERERRFASWRRKWAEDSLRAIDDLAAAGFEPADERARIAAILEAERARGTPPLANDHDLLRALDLSVYYARVYRLASEVVHYSIGSALDGFIEYPDRSGGGRVVLTMTDADRAEEALALAAITHGEFLERSEPVIRHGVTQLARRLLATYLNEKTATAAESSGDAG